MESLNFNMAAHSGLGFSIFSQQIKSILLVCMQCKPCVLRNGWSAEWGNGCILLPGLWTGLSTLCNLIHQHCLQGLAQPLPHSVLYSSQYFGGDSKFWRTNKKNNYFLYFTFCLKFVNLRCCKFAKLNKTFLKSDDFANLVWEIISTNFTSSCREI